MKKFLLLALAAVTLLAAGCSDDDGNEPGGGELELTAGSDKTPIVYADELTNEGVFGFKANSAWTSSISEKSGTRAADWVYISPSSGEAGTYSINIILETNYTGEDRSAEITVKCGGSEIKVTVTQKATTQEGKIPETPRLITGIKETALFTSDFYTAPGRSPYEPWSYEFTYDEQYRIKNYIVKEYDNSLWQMFSFDYSTARQVTVTTSSWHETAKGRLNDKGYVETLSYSYDGYDDEYYIYDGNGYLQAYDDEDGQRLIKFIWSGGNLVKLETHWDDEDDVTTAYNNVTNDKTNLDLNVFFMGLTYPYYLYEYARDEFYNMYAMAGLMGRRSANYAVSKNDGDPNEDKAWGGVYGKDDEPPYGPFETVWNHSFYGEGEYKYDAQGYPETFTHKVKVTKTVWEYNGKKQPVDYPEWLPEEERDFYIILEKGEETVKYDTYTYTISYNK